MKRAKTLVKQRNLIAHNPVMLDFYLSADETRAYAEYAIRSARSQHETMDLADLKELAAEVEVLASSLWMAFSNFIKTTDHLWNTWREANE